MTYFIVCLAAILIYVSYNKTVKALDDDCRLLAFIAGIVLFLFIALFMILWSNEVSEYKYTPVNVIVDTIYIKE